MVPAVPAARWVRRPASTVTAAPTTAPRRTAPARAPDRNSRQRPPPARPPVTSSTGVRARPGSGARRQEGVVGHARSPLRPDVAPGEPLAAVIARQLRVGQLAAPDVPQLERRVLLAEHPLVAPLPQGHEHRP